MNSKLETIECFVRSFAEYKIKKIVIIRAKTQTVDKLIDAAVRSNTCRKRMKFTLRENVALQWELVAVRRRWRAKASRGKKISFTENRSAAEGRHRATNWPIILEALNHERIYRDRAREDKKECPKGIKNKKSDWNGFGA